MPYHQLHSLIRKCTSTTTLAKARQLHALILTCTPLTLRTPFLHNNLLSMYAKCGSLHDSRKVFDQMPQRTLVSFNALISPYSRFPKQAVSAFQLLSHMIMEGFRPNASTFTSLFQAASSLEHLPMGTALHSQILKFGFFTHACVQTSLLGMYSTCGDLHSSERVFVDMVDKDAVAWNSIIFGFLKNDETHKGLQLFCNMVMTSFTPTHFTYSMILNACSRTRDYCSGKVIHAQIIKSTQPPDVPLQNALLDMYSSCGHTQTAFYVFTNIPTPDLVSWNSIIRGYSESGDCDKAMQMFVQLCQTCFDKPDEYTFATIISTTEALPMLDYGKPLHAQVEKAGYDTSVILASTLISMYLKNDEIVSAEKIFYSVSHKDVIVWTEMISGYSRLGDSEIALNYFYQMQENGHKVDSFSLSSALSLCADLTTLEQGEMIHCQAVKTGYEEYMCVLGSLVDMYAKNGNLEAAELVFSTVVDPDLKCWNAMLGGYGNHGKAKEAIGLFEDIFKQGLIPDLVTFVSLLSASNNCGLVEAGKFFWNYMKRDGLQPGPKHYSCMVSLLSRAGLLQEAEELIIDASFGGYFPELWRILLSACVLYRNLELGVHAAEQVLRLDNEDSATLILLSNLYAASGRWDAAAEIRKKIRGMMLEKDPGLSWIYVMDKIHAFTSGDQSHPYIDDIQDEMNKLHKNMLKLEIYEI